VLCLILPVIFRKIDFNDKEGCIVYRFTRFHVYESCSRAGQGEGGAVPVCIYLVVVYSFSPVILHVFYAYIERSLWRTELAPYMYPVSDVPDDIALRIGFQPCGPSVRDAAFVHSPPVTGKPVVFRADCNGVMAVPFHIQIVQAFPKVESVYQILRRGIFAHRHVFQFQLDIGADVVSYIPGREHLFLIFRDHRRHLSLHVFKHVQVYSAADHAGFRHVERSCLEFISAES